MVVYSEPPWACQNLKGPPNITGYDGQWILLAARYNCSFEIKVRMAQKAGYDAVIIHNVNSEELGKDIKIFNVIRITENSKILFVLYTFENKIF